MRSLAGREERALGRVGGLRDSVNGEESGPRDGGLADCLITGNAGTERWGARFRFVFTERSCSKQ